MRDIQAGGQPPHEGAHRVVGHGAFEETLGQRLAVDEFHHEIGPPERGIDGKEIVADDRVMQQVVQAGFLAEERQRRLVLREIGPDDLDGDDVAGLDAVAFVDFAHAAGADVRSTWKMPLRLAPGAPPARIGENPRTHGLSPAAPPPRRDGRAVADHQR